MADKTEQATPRRLRKAREEGDSGASGYVAQACAFLVAVALAPAAITRLAAWASASLSDALAHAAEPRAAAHLDPAALATSVVALTVPTLAAVAIAGAVAHAVQTGGVVATKKLALGLERLDPITGFQKLFSGARLFAVARALVAAAVVGWLAVQALHDHAIDIARTTGRPRWIGVELRALGEGLAWRAAMVGLALGAIDVLVTRTVWMRRLRMSKDEVKREHRDAEGDPQIKAARERAYHDILAHAAIADVRAASVVVVKPTHHAGALRYDPSTGDDAPTVIATGEGELAARIVRAARDFGIPVVRDVPLAHALVALGRGDVIPEALYQAVAEILREAWGPDVPSTDPTAAVR